MAQHFLLSTKARTLSLAKVMRLTDEEAAQTFMEIRWADNSGKPYCPKCGVVEPYTLKGLGKFKCRECYTKFTATSGTIFASRKLAIRDILAAIAIFMNGAKGHSALQLSRDLDVQYKTAFVLQHKIREALAAENLKEEISGEVEIDGAYFGGYVKPANYKKDRIDRRLAMNRTGKRRVVVVIRERTGTTQTQVFKAEEQGVAAVVATVKEGSTVYADEATHWDELHARFLTKRINHSEAYSHDGANTNMAESFFSRLRRAEIGIHHQFAGKYLDSYAAEMAWREDHRRLSNGEQMMEATRAVSRHPVSRQWKGYWQRRATKPAAAK